MPHPALFAFHKLIIASLRKEKSKSDKDTQEAIRTLKELLSKDGSGVIYRYFQVLLPTWRKKVLKKHDIEQTHCSEQYDTVVSKHEVQPVQVSKWKKELQEQASS